MTPKKKINVQKIEISIALPTTQLSNLYHKECARSSCCFSVSAKNFTSIIELCTRIKSLNCYITFQLNVDDKNKWPINGKTYARIQQQMKCSNISFCRNDFIKKKENLFCLSFDICHGQKKRKSHTNNKCSIHL